MFENFFFYTEIVENLIFYQNKKGSAQPNSLFDK